MTLKFQTRISNISQAISLFVLRSFLCFFDLFIAKKCQSSHTHIVHRYPHAQYSTILLFPESLDQTFRVPLIWRIEERNWEGQQHFISFRLFTATIRHNFLTSDRSDDGESHYYNKVCTTHSIEMCGTRKVLERKGQRGFESKAYRIADSECVELGRDIFPN